MWRAQDPHRNGREKLLGILFHAPGACMPRLHPAPPGQRRLIWSHLSPPFLLVVPSQLFSGGCRVVTRPSPSSGTRTMVKNMIR